MKASLILLAVSASLATSQLIGPECAKQCISDALTKDLGNCQTTDVKCICQSKSFINGVGDCVIKACKNDPTALQQIIEQATALCLNFGVSLDTNIPTATPSDTAPTTVLATATDSTTLAISSGTGLPTANHTGKHNITTTTGTPNATQTGAATSNMIAGGLTMAGAAIAAFLLL